MIQSSHKLCEQLFDQTDSIIFNVIPDRPAAEIPVNSETAYQTGFEDALIDAKVFFRMVIMRILGEEQ
jgi:hypothetical protein